MKALINLTQHCLTDEQVNDFSNMFPDEDVRFINASGSDETIKNLLTFDELPNMDELEERALLILKDLGCTPDYALIGGASFFMSTLEKFLKVHHITPLYSFSKRQSVEVASPNGSVIKTSVFKHVGYINVGDSDDYVRVKRSDLKHLIAETNTLEALLSYGVDNWDGYEEAMNDPDYELSDNDLDRYIY